MTTTAATIDEHGMLRPLSPLPLAEGARVEVSVTDEVAISDTVRTNRALELLREVAALPMEGNDTGFSGRDHDRILYGGPAKVP